MTSFVFAYLLVGFGSVLAPLARASILFHRVQFIVSKSYFGRCSVWIGMLASMVVGAITWPWQLFRGLTQSDPDSETSGVAIESVVIEQQVAFVAPMTPSLEWSVHEIRCEKCGTEGKFAVCSNEQEDYVGTVPPGWFVGFSRIRSRNIYYCCLTCLASTDERIGNLGEGDELP
jgi:hypothetical protein